MNNGMYSKHYLGRKGLQYSSQVGQLKKESLGFNIQAKYFKKYLNRRDNVLDFGCGNGGLTQILGGLVKSISALEINPHSRRIALRKGLIVYKELRSVPLKKYDKIVTNHVLEHIPNIYETLINLKSKLKPSGCLIIIVPIEDIRKKENKIWREDDLDNHLYSWTPLQFGNLLQEAGFKPLEIRVIENAWHPKLFFLGIGILQKISGFFLSKIKHRKELFAVAKKI